MKLKPIIYAGGVLAVALTLAGDSRDVKLPPPFATPSVDNGPHVVERPDGVQLKLPAGFQIEVYAEGFEQPRYMLQGPAGELIVSDSTKNGSVFVLRANTERT